jgi:hypothetical protein
MSIGHRPSRGGRNVLGHRWEIELSSLIGVRHKKAPPERVGSAGREPRPGQPCRSPATKKGRCRLHGGAKGSAGPPGKRNGQYRHGERTAIAEQRKFSALLKILRAGLT